ncbi:hypothetical protein J2Z69_002681 [Paenibacillus shirakamiensis]|uniref:Secreted protein n=1 Tax=Paenibacillus shirakamiensis TaxID=1265935 RepID=A0ABS4JIV9_9BACL|nr:hypothetical protein [Paenibacillus shirakamiensis]MBP2001636.1 hypothetical protein [Paenibacillus shirakamiensis]
MAVSRVAALLGASCVPAAEAVLAPVGHRLRFVLTELPAALLALPTQTQLGPRRPPQLPYGFLKEGGPAVRLLMQLL